MGVDDKNAAREDRQLHKKPLELHDEKEKSGTDVDSVR
jgi:hypothetical protein